MRYFVTIFFILCPLVFAQSNIDEDSIHFIGQASAFTVGVNLVTNGTFAADSGWTKGTGWTTAGGDADCDGSAGGDTELLSDNAITTVTGTVYRVQFEVTVYSAGNVVAVFDGVEVGSDKSAVGVYTTYVAATDVSSTISIVGDLNFIGSIDNVSVVAWVGDLNAGGGCTIATFTGTLTDYMSATGGVLHHGSGLAMDDAGGYVVIFATTTWDTAPQVGGFVNVDFDGGPLGNGVNDGIFKIRAATTNLMTIDTTYTAGDNAIAAEVWIGGAYPDIATAINDSTLSQDPGGGTGQYRKRYICVNVPMEVDAVTDFVAENSETALREDDGSRKIIGFYDSISVVQPAGSGVNDGYRVVSDMDEGQPYYAGARKAFNQEESFPVIRPDGKWIEWNAKGNDFGATGIVVLDTSNVEMRNLHIFNTIADAGTEGLIHTDTANFNITFINCWFDTSSRWQVNDLVSTGCSILDCYFGGGIDSCDFIDFQQSVFAKCIFNAGSRVPNVLAGAGDIYLSSLVYEGQNGISYNSDVGMSVHNCIFYNQTSACIVIAASNRHLLMSCNNIFSPLASDDRAISITNGSSSPASYNNIIYSVAARSVLVGPIAHDQISPNPPLPVGTLEVDPLFVNPAIGDFRLRASSPALNGGMRSLFNGWTTIGANQPYSSPNAGYRSRYNFKGHNYTDR